MPDLSSKSFAAEGASLPYRQRVDGCLEGAIGAHGLTSAQIERWLDKVAPALAALREDYRTGRVPLLKVPEETADIEAAAGALGRLSTGAETIVFFGTGG